MRSMEEREMADTSWSAGKDTAATRQLELMKIMQDAVQHVLERPDTRRGPYILSDSDLESIRNAAAK